jgi:hypothetical protein
MIAISNAGLANIGLPPVNMTGFAPAVSAAITWGTNIVFTDASTFPAGDSFGIINITVNDDAGGTASGHISAASGTATISTTGLKQTGVYQIACTVASTKGCLADGGIDVTVANSTATVGNYSLSFTTAHN